MSVCTETIVLEKGGTGLGFNIRGGTDNMHVSGDPGIFVTSIKMDGAAAKDGRLQPGDKLLEINGNDLRSIPHYDAVKFFHDTGNEVTLMVEKGAEQRITNTDQERSLSADNKIRVPSTGVYEESRHPSLLYLIPLALILGTSALAVWWFLGKRRQ